MGDVLDQSEVDALLAAVDAGQVEQEAPPQVFGRAGQAQIDVQVYDFKRPERVSKDQMRAFQALHDGFSREFGAALSGMLRTIVEAKLISVDQLTYSEFVFSLENPTCFNLINAKPLEGQLILDINLSDMDGRKVCQRVKGRPETQHTRVVAISGYIEAHEFEGLRDYGFDDYLRKPFSIEELTAKVQSVWFSPGHHDLHLEFPERVADLLDKAVRDGFFA